MFRFSQDSKAYTSLRQSGLIFCVNCVVQGVPRLNIFLGVCVSTSLGEVSIWISEPSKVDHPSRCGWHHPITWEPEWNKRQRKEEVTLLFLASLLELGLLISSPPALRLGFTLSLSLEAFGLRLNYITGFLGPPASTQQTVGLLSLHNCVSRFLIVNMNNRSVCIYALFLRRTPTNAVTWDHLPEMSFWGLF